MELSICTTNYNCAHALPRHLESVFRELQGIEFEYIVVDNKSGDSSLRILQKWGKTHPNTIVLSRRCTMGEGRQIAFRHSKGRYILVLDTDVVYSSLLRPFVDRYLSGYSQFSVQAIQAGAFPRDQWIHVGGRRSLNTNEDADMWLRIETLGSMRWYPVSLGENLKDPSAWGRFDHLSNRYQKSERVRRLLRRELDLLKTREVEHANLSEHISRFMIDMELGPVPKEWPQHRTHDNSLEHLLRLARELMRILRAP